VDETVVEPSKAAVRSYLAGLGLSYPVGLDSTGRVADGYGVQDQPWFSLVSASGKIVWSHDGWLSLPALEAAASSHLLLAPVTDVMGTGRHPVMGVCGGTALGCQNVPDLA
jgi:hypothetical protein